MSRSLTVREIDWHPLLQQMQLVEGQNVPAYPGDLKAALINHAGLSHHSKAEGLYQLAHDIAALTTCCDPEITYWFSRLISLID